MVDTAARALRALKPVAGLGFVVCLGFTVFPLHRLPLEGVGETAGREAPPVRAAPAAVPKEEVREEEIPTLNVSPKGAQAPKCEVPQGMSKAYVSGVGGPFTMVVLGPNDIVSNDVMSMGYFEYRTPQDFAEKAHVRLPRGGTFLDIGANLGFYSLHFASMGYRVFAFEPMTRNRRALLASLCFNPQFSGRVTVVPIALTGPAELGMRCVVRSTNDQINIGNGFLTCGRGPEVKPCSGPSENCEEVAVRTLDQALVGLGIRAVDVVKIDVEVHECQILAGGQSLFAALRPRLLKVETEWGNSSACVKEAAAVHGYDLFPAGMDTLMAARKLPASAA